MTNSWRRIAIGGVFFTLTCVVATFGYMAAGWHALDAIYMVVITVFGVGYGEAKPLESPGLKIFTMGVIVAGCSSGIYVVGGFVSMIAEGEINRMLGTRRMSKEIDGLKNHIIICGFGRVGQMLARDLADAGQEIVIVDTSDSRVDQAQRAGFLSVTGNASEESTLEAAGIDHARALATVLPDDAANVFITLVARELSRDGADHRPRRISVDREEAAAFWRDQGGDAGLDRRDQNCPNDYPPLRRGPVDRCGGQDAFA